MMNEQTKLILRIIFIVICPMVALLVMTFLGIFHYEIFINFMNIFKWILLGFLALAILGGIAILLYTIATEWGKHDNWMF